MSFIEKRIVNNKVQHYFVKKITLKGKVKTIKRYIGTDLKLLSKNKYILENIDSLVKEELKLRIKELDNDLSYNEDLIYKVEEKAIKINYLIEAKQAKNMIQSDFAKEFIFNSNNIEGSKISEEEVKKLIESGDTNHKDKNEVKEVLNSIEAYNYLDEEFKFNLVSIKRLYYILTKDLFMESKKYYPKGFKTKPNIVGDSTTTSPELVKKELKELLKWYKKKKKILHPLILAYEFHKNYEYIHPFEDGNGRTGRLIMNKILLSTNYPPLLVYKENKRSYFNSLKQAKEGKIKKYTSFMLKQTDKSYDFLLKSLKKY